MRISTRKNARSFVFRLTAVALLAAAATRLPAGVGNLGRTVSIGAGGAVDVTINPTFSETVSAGESISAARNNLVALINADPNFAAASVVDPADPNSNSFSVTPESGGDLAHMKVCENDPNIDNIGVSFAGGKDKAILNRVASVSGDGDYRLRIDLSAGVDFDQTISTAGFAGNPSGLNSAIKTALNSAGFTVGDDGWNLTIRKPGDLLLATRVSSSDTGVVIFCLDMASDSLQAPGLSRFGAFLLMLLITAAAVLLLRRRAASA